MAGRRVQMWLLGTFAAVAVGMAAIGLYGVMSYSVTRRTHEIGVRMALGAKRRDVLSLLLRQGLKLAGFGIGLGVPIALGLTSLLRTLLFEVKPTDPVTFVGVSLILLLVALLASWLPARRAAKVDPMQALRTE